MVQGYSLKGIDNFSATTEMVPDLIWVPEFFGPQVIWSPRTLVPKKFGPEKFGPHESWFLLENAI